MILTTRSSPNRCPTSIPAGASIDAAGMLPQLWLRRNRRPYDRQIHASRQPPSARARKAADVMRGFDGRMAADSAAATIEATSRQHLWKLLLESKLGNDWVNYEWSESSVALENIMQNQPDRWLPSAYGNFNELLTAAVEGAVSAAPTDLASWKYGNEFPVEINHPLLAPFP